VNGLTVALDEEFRRGRADPFVAVHERVIQHQRVHERRRHSCQVRIEVVADEGHRRSGHSGLEQPTIAQRQHATEPTTWSARTCATDR
jgi:hypothetical protein